MQRTGAIRIFRRTPMMNRLKCWLAGIGLLAFATVALSKER